MAGGDPSGHSTRLLGCRPSPSCSGRTSFTKKVREHKPTEAAPTQHAAADQQASKSMLVAAALILLLVDVVIVLLLAPLAKEACRIVNLADPARLLPAPLGLSGAA